MDHLRAFEVWVPNTSAARITNTVWWFLKDLLTDPTKLPDQSNTAYPTSRTRPNPRDDDGTDLIGRVFVEPELGVCVVTAAGPIVDKPLNTRAQRMQRARTEDDEPLLQPGTHFTLIYRHMNTGEEHFSSVTEMVCWIAIGPLLPPPASTDAKTHDNPTEGATNSNTREQRVPTLNDTATQRQEQRVAVRRYDANGIQMKRTPDQDTGKQQAAKRLRTKAPPHVRFAMDPQSNSGITQSETTTNRDRRSHKKAREESTTATEPSRWSPRFSAHLAATDTQQPKPGRRDVLQPRPQWMKDAMPGVSDEEADQTWHDANHRLCGHDKQETDSPASRLTP
jgi:hypothetical protein